MRFRNKIFILIAVIPSLFALLLYLGGLIGQIITNYTAWLREGGMTGYKQIATLHWDLRTCFRQALTPSGLCGILLCAAIFSVGYIYLKICRRFDKGEKDPRGFTVSRFGTYGTASWMDEKELKRVLELAPINTAEGTILGEYRGKAVCMPKDTELNRHIVIFGASGTGKSRAVIRNALFQALRRGESVIVTDSKAELYADTAELYRQNGYDVKVLDLISPDHSDTWNCMSGLNSDTLMAQVLADVIIGNTSSNRGDRFWDNGEGNLLKALILYVDTDKSLRPEQKNLASVYRLLTQNNERQLTAIFEKLPISHPAKAPYNLFSQAGDTVRSGIILGLGTRLQVLQNEAVGRITGNSDIELTAPGRKRCAYYIILSDQDATMAFLSSLFFSCLFIRLIRFADTCKEGRCPVPVNLILDEFNNVGRIGGASDGSDFARTLSVIRSRGIRVMLAVQSMGQLQNRYPNNLWAEITGNCDIQLMLGCTDDVGAEYFSMRSGDMSIEVDSTMTERKTLALIQFVPHYRSSKGQGRRRVLTPDEILRMPRDEMLCVIRGCNILKLKKLDYTKHPMSREIRKISVFDYAPHPIKTPESKPFEEDDAFDTLYRMAKPPDKF